MIAADSPGDSAPAPRSGPRRIQLQRTKGWRKPAGAIVVARPSRWGNPFLLGLDGDRELIVRRYREALGDGKLAFSERDVRTELAGHDLACWCPLDAGCHADVLLEVASRW
jgi:hypothetical protein